MHASVYSGPFVWHRRVDLSSSPRAADLVNRSFESQPKGKLKRLYGSSSLLQLAQPSQEWSRKRGKQVFSFSFNLPKPSYLLKYSLKALPSPAHSAASERERGMPSIHCSAVCSRSKRLVHSRCMRHRAKWGRRLGTFALPFWAAVRIERESAG